MMQRLIMTTLISVLGAGLLIACGNKGELYRIPDPISQEDLDVLDETLDEIETQTLDSGEVKNLDTLTAEELEKLKAKKPTQ